MSYKGTRTMTAYSRCSFGFPLWFCCTVDFAEVEMIPVADNGLGPAASFCVHRAAAALSSCTQRSSVTGYSLKKGLAKENLES